MLREAIDDYVTMKRAMGFKYRVKNSLLQLFATFAEARGNSSIRSQTVLEWAGLAPSPAQRRNRLLTVIRFAIADNQSEMPPENAFGAQPGKRRIPHIFTSEEVSQLLCAASQLKPQRTIRAKTYTAFFALLATTGLRISEAQALNMEDITDDGLMIKSTKFRKDRLVPLHVSVHKGIECYCRYQVQYYTNHESALFISNKGLRLPYSTVVSTFLQLIRAIGLRGGAGAPGACVHDLRHTFAVKSLEQCTGDRTAISRHMTALSTYLGHAHISDTYWYLQATPRLLTQISTLQENCYREACDD